jgi:hypothetical protein
MFGLMTLWFGPFVDLRPDYGYFHLCPACYRQFVKPHLDEVQGRLAELHPLNRHLGPHHETDNQDEADAGGDASGGGSSSAPDAVVAGRAADGRA